MDFGGDHHSGLRRRHLADIESFDEVAILVLALRDLREQLAATVDPLIDDPGFTPLQLQLGRVADRLRGILSQSRYAYDVPEERDG
jgi:hypothetical protein